MGRSRVWWPSQKISFHPMLYQYLLEWYIWSVCTRYKWSYKRNQEVYRDPWDLKRWGAVRGRRKGQKISSPLHLLLWLFCLCLSTPISLLLSSYFSVYLSLSLLPPHLSLIIFFTSRVISPSLIHFLISTKEDRQFEETYYKSKQIV